MKKTIFILGFFLAWVSVVQANHTDVEFSDLAADSEYHHSVSKLVELDLVEGYEQDNTFRPDQLVTRAEFLKLVYLAELYSTGKVKPDTIGSLFDGTLDLNCFDDVSEEDWHAPIVCLNKQNGKVKGYLDNTFGPNEHVNVGEAAKMMTPSSIYESEEHWAATSLNLLGPRTLTTSIDSVGQELTRKEAVEIVWRYFFADHFELEERESSLLAWDGSAFLDLDYIGKTAYWVECNYYGKNMNEVYHVSGCFDPTFSEVNLLPGADAETFKIVSDSYGSLNFSMALDARALYLREQKLEDTAGGEFKLLSDMVSSDYGSALYARDTENIYPIICYEGCHLYPEPFTGADFDSFERLDNSYYKDKDTIFYMCAGLRCAPPIVVDEADFDTFEPMEAGYARDKNHIYYLGKVIEADIESFVYLPEFDMAYDNYSTFKSGKAYEGSTGGYLERIEGADYYPKIDSKRSNYYLRDQSQVYFMSCENGDCYPYHLTNLDASSFEFLGNGYSKDDAHVYRELYSIDQADADSFAYLKFKSNNPCPSSFAIDEEHVYLGGEPLLEINVDSFEILQEHGFYFKDGNGIYKLINGEHVLSFSCYPRELITLEEADLNSFEPHGFNYFISEGLVYYVTSDGRVFQAYADPETFGTYSVPEQNEDSTVKMNFAYFAFDKDNVFMAGAQLPTLDVATFAYDPDAKTYDHSGWSDKNGGYTWQELSEMYENIK